MKHGLSLVELAEEIERRKTAKADYVTDRSNLWVRPVEGDLKLEIKGQDQVGINAVAHSQFASVLNIPKAYYDRCLEEKPDLIALNVNAWLRHTPEKKQIVRTLDGTCRALVSDRFRTDLEYEDVAEACLPALTEAGAHIHSCAITDKRLYIKAVNEDVKRALEKVGGQFGDGQHNIVRVTSPAVTLSNSEVGFGAFSLTGGVYDAFCSNLASFKERSMRKHHVGAAHEMGDETVALLSQETRRKTAEAVVAQIKDVMKAAFEEEGFNKLCDSIEATHDNKIDGDVVKVVEFGCRSLGVTQDESKSVLKHLISGGDLSQFGLFNAVTRAAQDDTVDYDRATELEAVGGQIINLRKSQWEQIAIAA